ncbi:hypothetical protein JCM16303_001376 [Sporobolomyces ruberrimus]
MPQSRPSARPPSPDDWTREPLEEASPSGLSPTLAQRRQVAAAPTIHVGGRTDDSAYEEELADGGGRASLSPSTSLHPPPTPHSPAGLLLFRRRSSTTAVSQEEDDAFLPVEQASPRRSSDTASSAALHQISSTTTSRRTSWGSTTIDDTHARPAKVTPSAAPYNPPPSSSSAHFAASSLLPSTSIRYTDPQPLFSIEASPLIPSSITTTPDSSVDLPSVPSFPSSLLGDRSPDVDSFEYASAVSPRRPSYSVVTLDPRYPSSRSSSTPFLQTPTKPLSSRSIRRQLRRVLVAFCSLVALIILIGPSRLANLPTLVGFPDFSFSSQTDVAHFLTKPMRPSTENRNNKTHVPGDQIYDDEGSRATETGTGTNGAYPVREEIKEFREEQLWAHSETKLRTRVSEPRNGFEHEATIIMNHGLSQSIEYNSWLHLELGAKLPTVRWVMPQAPKIPITFHDKEVRPAWFDIKSFPWKEVEDSDTDHYFASTRAINDVVREERDRLINAERKRRGKELGAPGTNEEREWASKRILIGGFSQGGVMSLLAGLTNEERLGGIFVFSGMLPVRDLLPEIVRDLDRTDLPIWWGHGETDPYLLYVLTTTSLVSRAFGLAMTQVTFGTYPHLGHTWTKNEVDDLAKWMGTNLDGPFVPVAVAGQPHGARSMKRRM